MRAWVVAIAVVACKGGTGKDQPAPTPPAKPAIAVPSVGVATVLAKDDGRPPLLLLVGDVGGVRLATARTWADLDGGTLAIANKAGKTGVVGRFVREQYELGRDPADTAGQWDKLDDSALGELEDATKPGAPDQDDPPPPPPDDEDDSGGTGTAMALDEGRGQAAEDPALARQQAIDQARAAGILGAPARGLIAAGGPGAPNEDGTPSRVAQVAGVVAKDGKLDRLPAMILVAPAVKASKLIEAVRDTGAAIAVSYGGKIRPLHLQFGMRDTASRSWLEARVSAAKIVVEAVPDVPLEVGALDQLGAAVAKARAAHGTGPDAPVDVLVDPDISVQRMIDVIVALDTAGVQTIGMGAMPSADELARRGHRIATTEAGPPVALGDFDKATIRAVIKHSVPRITACYETALQTQPNLSGTVQAQFFITPAGTVASANAAGVSPEVASCIAGVIKTLVFPKPKGGGGVQVNYPFTLHPAGE